MNLLATTQSSVSQKKPKDSIADAFGDIFDKPAEKPADNPLAAIEAAGDGFGDFDTFDGANTASQQPANF